MHLFLIVKSAVFNLPRWTPLFIRLCCFLFALLDNVSMSFFAAEQNMIIVFIQDYGDLLTCLLNVVPADD